MYTVSVKRSRESPTLIEIAYVKGMLKEKVSLRSFSMKGTYDLLFILDVFPKTTTSEALS